MGGVAVAQLPDDLISQGITGDLPIFVLADGKPKGGALGVLDIAETAIVKQSIAIISIYWF